MPISWNEIRARAARFADEWKDAYYEKGETQTFYNEFFEVFGNRRRNVAVYEEKVKKLNDKYGFIDLFWPSHLLEELWCQILNSELHSSLFTIQDLTPIFIFTHTQQSDAFSVTGFKAAHFQSGQFTGS